MYTWSNGLDPGSPPHYKHQEDKDYHSSLFRDHELPWSCLPALSSFPTAQLTSQSMLVNPLLLFLLCLALPHLLGRQGNIHQEEEMHPSNQTKITISPVHNWLAHWRPRTDGALLTWSPLSATTKREDNRRNGFDVQWLILIVNLTYIGSRNFDWKLAPIRLAYRHVRAGVFLIATWWGNAQPSVGSTIPRQMDLDYIRKQADHKPWSKLVRSDLCGLYFRSYF